jgi:hypothetical protein
MYFSRQEPMNREEYCKQTSKKKRDKRISTDCNQNNKGDKEKHHSGNSAASCSGCPGSIRNPRKRRDFNVFFHRSPGGCEASGSDGRKKWLFSADSLVLTTEKLAAGGLRNI